MPDVNETEPTIVNNTFVQCEGHDAKDRARLNVMERQIHDARERQRELDAEKAQIYPYMDGGTTVLGPEVFAKGSVLSWKGENYVPQEQVRALTDLRAVAGIHCGALGELFHDAGIEMPENALRLYLILLDELTLKLDALAKSHPAAMPRVPKGLS